jgi:hypothetical protein
LARIAFNGIIDGDRYFLMLLSAVSPEAVARGGNGINAPRRRYWWQTSFAAMQVFPQGLPVVHFGALVWAEPPLRHVLINCLRASPFMLLAWLLQSFIRWC